MSRWPNKYVIGLTGNIATGKSIVRKMVQHLGAYTIDADSLAHQTMMPGAPAYKPVVTTFGQMIVGEDGRINRKALGDIVFSNPEALKKLEAITHPVVRQAINVLAGRSKQRVVVIEAIKLLEGDLKDWVDVVWVMDAKPQTQYKRLIKDRKMSEEDAKKRILAQGKQAEKLKQAGVVIDNDGDVEQTWKQVQTQWSEIRKLLTGGQQTASPAKSATPAKAAAPAAPADPVEDTMDAAEKTVDAAGLTVKRGMPGNAQLIADFMNAHREGGEDVARMDVMLSFGQKSYLIAQDKSESVAALMGWTVENLVTSMDEFYVKSGFPARNAVNAMVVAVEDASKELQSEAAFLFLPTSTPTDIISAFNEHEYNPITLKEIKIPVWREAVEEVTSQQDVTVLWKQLRKDRVLQPI